MKSGVAIDQSRAERAPISGKPSEPVKVWAVIGAVVLIAIFYSLYQWVTSDHFRPSPVGDDPIPDAVLYWVRSLEAVSVLIALFIIWATLINPWRKTGEISWDGMLCIIALSLLYQDPIDNYFNFVFSYNAYFYNFTSWATYIPGWQSPRQENFPEPILFLTSLYIIFLCGLTIVGGWILNKCKTHWFPRRSILFHVLVVFVTFFLIDFVMEVIFCRTEIFGYGGTFEPLTLWAGEYYQFPLYESACVSSIVTALSVLRYFKDDKGCSFAERGVENLKLPPKQKKMVSFLAILGFSHLTYFIVFFFPFTWFALMADSYPETSSYMRYEACGVGTPYACASREVPIPSKTSLFIGPNDPRLSDEAKRN